MLIATCSGIEAYGHVLEWMHMIEHLLLIMVAPVLLAIGSPLQLVAEALPPRAAAGWRAFLDRPVVGWLTSPPFAAAFYAVCVIGVHLTGLMDRAMADDGVHVAEELAYLLAGMLLFQLVVGQRPGPWQLSGGARMALLAIVTPVDTLVGVVLLQTGTVAGGIGADGHAHPRPDWALSAASDTAAAGTTMWIGGTGIMGLVMLGGRADLAARPRPRAGEAGLDRAGQGGDAGRAHRRAGADRPRRRRGRARGVQPVAGEDGRAGPVATARPARRRRRRCAGR